MESAPGDGGCGGWGDALRLQRGGCCPSTSRSGHAVALREVQAAFCEYLPQPLTESADGRPWALL